MRGPHLVVHAICPFHPITPGVLLASCGKVEGALAGMMLFLLLM